MSLFDYTTDTLQDFDDKYELDNTLPIICFPCIITSAAIDFVITATKIALLIPLYPLYVGYKIYKKKKHDIKNKK